jgi:hypothetical protein
MPLDASLIGYVQRQFVEGAAGNCFKRCSILRPSDCSNDAPAGLKKTGARGGANAG